MSDYCDSDDIKDLFGNDNVEKWADLDNDEDTTKIAARIARSITAAMADFDSRMLGGPYTIPMTGTILEEVKQITATLAGVWLYERRGVEDYDAENETSKHRLSFQKDEAYQKIDQYRAGTRRIAAASEATTSPYAHDHYTQIADDDDLTSEVRQGETS